MHTKQLSLDLIQHEVNDSIIAQRATDGYINATALCKAAGKQWDEYNSNKPTKDYLDVVSSKTGIPVLGLVQVVTTLGIRAIWVHPKIAIHLGQWLSPEFAYQVAEWVEDWMSGKEASGTTRGAGHLPPHIRRYLLNQPAVPAGHFTILQEITFILTGPLESLGYELAEHFLPDGSLGRMFCAHLRKEHGVNTSLLPKYIHTYEDGRQVEANAYPIELLPTFRRYATGTWLPTHCPKYLGSKDPEVLPYLDKMTALPNGPRPPANLPSWKRKA